MRLLIAFRAELLAGVAGASAVLFGAFGAHALRPILTPVRLELWRMAVQYQFWHALALAVAALKSAGKARRITIGAFGLGIVLFSGSLYGLALGGSHWLGIVTPFGGVAFMVGWLALGTNLKATL